MKKLKNIENKSNNDKDTEVTNYDSKSLSQLNASNHLINYRMSQGLGADDDDSGSEGPYTYEDTYFSFHSKLKKSALDKPELYIFTLDGNIGSGKTTLINRKCIKF